jgi:hypothetical protein
MKKLVKCAHTIGARSNRTIIPEKSPNHAAHQRHSAELFGSAFCRKAAIE